jgi:MFS family permease
MGGRLGFGLAGRQASERAARAGDRACWRRPSGCSPTPSSAGLGGFYAVAVLVGFIYAGVMPLYAVILRENFPLKMMGTVIGGTAMAGSLGMSTGPLLGGLIYDRLGKATCWLYVGSWGMGLAAMLIADDLPAVSQKGAGIGDGVGQPASAWSSRCRESSARWSPARHRPSVATDSAKSAARYRSRPPPTAR